MNLTQSDIRAAREGFKYVAVRGGKRVAYCSTQQEAKREAGSRGHVVSLSGLRYTSRNPSSGAKQKARNPRRIHFREGDFLFVTPVSPVLAESYPGSDVEAAQVVRADEDGASGGLDVYYVTRSDGEEDAVYGFQIERKVSKNRVSWGQRNPSSGAKQKARGSRHYGQTYHRGTGEWRDDYSGPTSAERLTSFRRQLGAMKKAGHKIDVRKEFAHELATRNPSAAGVGHAVGKHTKYAARGAKRVAKSAWAGTKSFFGSAYKSFKAHNPARPTRKAIATDFRLWQEYVDPYGNTTREEFDGMSIQRKMAIMRSIWPSRPAHNPRRVDDGSGKY